MDSWHVVALALVQGLTEFLPISSSAHLILLPFFAQWPDQGLSFDVAVHVGTLAAVVAYFRRDLGKMLADWLESLRLGRAVGESRMLWIASTTIGFGLLLWWADAVGGQARDEHGMAWRDALIIGCAQALAVVPGTSRSGITITAGRALGLSRQAAARFSFLLSIPVIVLAGSLKAYEALVAASTTQWAPLAMGSVVAFLSAYLCIDVFLKLMARMSLLPFVLYRLVLGVVLFALVL
jgi:undecaprenyl-diphosphatase